VYETPAILPAEIREKRRNDLIDPFRGLKDHIENVARVLSFEKDKNPATLPRILYERLQTL